MDAPAQPSKTRGRLPLWIGLIVLILLFPAIVIPLLVGAFDAPAFASPDEVQVEQIESIELFIHNRPDGGPDIGGTRGLFPVPRESYDRLLKLLRTSVPSASATQRGIWLGRIVFTLKNGRTQTVYVHRPTTEAPGVEPRVELRIGRLQFDGPAVKAFLAELSDIAGQK